MQTVEVHVGAAQHGHQRLVFQLLARCIQFGTRNRQCAGRLKDGTSILEYILDRGAHFVRVHQDDFIHIFFADAESFFPRQLDCGAVREQADIAEGHAFFGLERTVHRIGIYGLHADHLDLGAYLLDVSRHACNQAAAADGTEDRLDRLRMLAQYFHADGALPRNDVRIVKRMHEAQLVFFLQLQGVTIGIVVAVTVQNNFDGVLAKMPDRLNLHLGRGHGHHDDCLAAQLIGGQRNTLRMIAGRCGNDAALELLRRQLRHLVIGAAQLEGEHGLHVLAFQQHMVAYACGQAGRGFQRGFDGHVIDPGGEDTFEITLHKLSCCWNIY